MLGSGSRRYFLYAIGEIVLVVVGILIALQINNWNEDRKLTEKEIFYLEEIRESLENDLKLELKGCLGWNMDRIHAFKLLDSIFSETHYPTYSELEHIDSFFSGEWDLIFEIAPYENIKSIGINIISSDSIRSKISKLYSYWYPVLMNRSNILKQYYSEYILPVRHQQLEFGKTINTEQINSMKNDQSIKNKLGWLNRLREYLNIYLNKVIPVVEQLIVDISSEIHRLKK